MSKLVEGIKDRMVAAAREARARRGGCCAEGRDRPAAGEKVAEAVAEAKNAAGRRSLPAATSPSPSP